MRNIQVEKRTEFSGHRDAVYCLAPAGEEQLFYSASGDGLIIRWNLSKDVPGEVAARLPAAIYSLVFLKERQLLIAGTRFGSVYFLDVATKRQLYRLELGSDVFDLAYLSDQQLLAAATGGSGIYFIDPATFEIRREFHPTDKNAREIAVSPDGRTIATGWSDHNIRLYNTVQLDEAAAFKAHENSVFSLLYSADGQFLISGGRDAQINIWETRHPFSKLKNLQAHWYTVNDMVLSPDAMIFASASRDKSVRIWDISSFELLKVVDRSHYDAHTHSVNKLLWTMYDNILLSAGDDKIIRAWRVTEETD